ncbi:MAG: FAD-dependent oxidoreductase, partial [Fusobacteriaceae bacterium]
ASAAYEEKLIEGKVDIHFNSKVTKLDLAANSDVHISSLQIETSAGELIHIDADLVIICAGVRANVEFLENTSIKYDKRGLIFNKKGETNVKDVYGAGDVSGRGTIWSVAVKNGIVATSNMANVDRVMDDFFFEKSTMNFFDIPTLSLGCISSFDKFENLKIETMKDGKGVYKKIAHKDGHIYGAIIQGDLAYTGVLTQLIRLYIDISKIKKSVFNIDYSDFFNINSSLEFKYED